MYFTTVHHCDQFMFDAKSNDAIVLEEPNRDQPEKICLPNQVMLGVVTSLFLLQ